MPSSILTIAVDQCKPLRCLLRHAIRSEQSWHRDVGTVFWPGKVAKKKTEGRWEGIAKTRLFFASEAPQWIAFR